MVSRSFVILVISVLAVAALAFAVIRNPSPDEHRAELRVASPNPLVAGVSAYHSLGLVSYMEIGGRVVSIGLFGIVFVSSVAAIQLVLAIGALLIATGIFRIAAKRVHLAKPFLDRSVRSLKPLSDGLKALPQALKALSPGYWFFIRRRQEREREAPAREREAHAPVEQHEWKGGGPLGSRLFLGVLLAPALTVALWFVAVLNGYIDIGKTFGIGAIVVFIYLLIADYIAAVLILVPMALLLKRYGRLSVWRIVLISTVLGLVWNFGLDVAFFGVVEAIRNAFEYAEPRARAALWGGVHALVFSLAFCFFAWIPLRTVPDVNFRHISKRGLIFGSALFVDGVSLVAALTQLAFWQTGAGWYAIKAALFAALVLLLVRPALIANSTQLSIAVRALCVCIPLFVFLPALDYSGAFPSKLIDVFLAALIGILNWMVFRENVRSVEKEATV